LPEQLGEQRVDRGAGGDLQRKIAVRGLGELGVDRDFAGFRLVELRLEVVGGLLNEVGGGQGLRVLRQHQGGCVEGTLHRGADRSSTAEIDGGADKSEQWSGRAAKASIGATPASRFRRNRLSSMFDSYRDAFWSRVEASKIDAFS